MDNIFNQEIQQLSLKLINHDENNISTQSYVV